MAAPSNTSMSALGQFYDAVFAVAEDQAKKYGKEAKPDMVLGDFADGVAKGVADLAASFGVNPALGAAVQNDVVGKARDYFAGGWNVALNVGDWFPNIVPNRGIAFREATADEFGNYVGDGPAVKAGPDMKIDLNDVLDDPRKIAVSAADKYFDAQRTIIRLKAIAGLGADRQQAALFKTATKDIGVDSDVAATITHALVGIEKNNAAAGNIRDDVISSSLAMYAGVTREADRAELAKTIKGRLLKEVADQHKAYAGTYPTVGGTSTYAYGKAPDDFVELFGGTADNVKRAGGGPSNLLGEYSRADLFSANPYGATNPTPGRGAVLKQSFQSGIQKLLSDPTITDPRVRTSLMQLYSSFDDESKVYDLFKALNRSANNGYKDMSHLVMVGAAGLSAEYARQGDTASAVKYAKAGSLAGKLDGTMTWGDSAAYVYNRIKTNGLWGATAGITGSVLLGDSKALKSMIDGGSVLTSLAFSGSPRTGTKEGIRVAALLEQRNSGFALATTDRREVFSRFYMGREEFKRNPAGRKVLDATTGKYVTEMPRGEKAMRSIDWKPLDWAVDHNAGSIAKGAFAFQTFHPWQMVTGMFDGTTAQRFIWLGSGFGRHLGDPSKWDGLARFGGALLQNKAYKEMVYVVGYAKQVINLPSYFIKDAMQTVKKKVIDDFLVGYVGEKILMKAATKLGLEATLRAILGFLTEGASEAAIWIYEGVNFVTGGLLDKIVKGLLRVTFEFVISIFLLVIMVCISIPTIFLSASAAGTRIITSLSSAALYAPDENYNPKLVSYEPPPGGTGPTYPPGTTINLPGAKGIDVSHYQETIDWNQVATAGKVEFAIIKATEGTGWTDDYFKKNWSASKSAGIKRSAYHYFLGQYDGAKQADHFLSFVNKAGGGQDFELCIDVEWYGQTADPSDAARQLKKMVDRMYEATGVYPIIYTSSYAWADVVGNPGWGGPPYPLWIAGYVGNPKSLVMPKGWKDWEIWQYTDSGQVPGIKGGVDLDIWNDNPQ